jgi:chromosome segregation ATPase
VAKEAQFGLETEVRHLRDENSKWQREVAIKEDEYSDAIRALRAQDDEETRRMDAIINGLREDLNRSQNAKSLAQREVLEAQRDADRRVAIIQEALDTERSSKHRLHDEIRNKEQVTAELQGTVRLLTTRLQSKDDDLRRLENELASTSERVHEAHSIIGKKDAVIGQLNARLRVFESRGTL